PLILKGSIDYEASKLYTQWRYMQDSLNLEVADGKMDISSDYYFNLSELKETTLSNLKITLNNLRIKPKAQYKDVLTLKSLVVSNATIKPIVQKIHLKDISLNSLYIKAKRDKNGDIDWLEYIKVTPDIKEKEQKIEQKIKENPLPWNILIDKIALEKIKVDFDDSGVKPKVKTALNELNLYLQNITLDGKKPLSYQMNLVLNEKMKCNSSGDISHNILNIESFTKCDGIDVVHYRPYIDQVAKSELKVYDLKLRSLMAGFDANVSVKDVNSTIVIDVADANLKLEKFALNKRSTNKRLVNFSSFNVNGITLNSASKEIGINDTSLNYLSLNTLRDANGKLNLQDLVVPRKKKVSKIAKKKEKDYRIKLNKVAIKAARVNFEDKVLTPSVKAKVDRIYLTAYGIDSKSYSWMKYNFSAKINGLGKMKSKGKIRHTPLKQKGSLELDKISLKKLTPYLQEKAYVTLDDGYVSLKTKVVYEVSQNNPDLNIDGSFKVQEFFLSDSRDKSSLISFNDIDLKKFTLELSPNRLFVDEVDINSFYVNAIVDANKTMNFATLVKPQDDMNNTVESSVEDTPKSEPFPVKIMKINVALGSAQFSDNSLPIDFKTNIHDLNGVIYAVSNVENEVSYVDIVGEVDEYGSTKLKGSVNSSNPKAFTDLSFNFRNLDLSAMSGYSGSFAGHKIDKGKLFLNLNYDIQESKLVSENSIIVKSIELGDEMETEDGSSLPLGFVIALLEDSDGVIDIDMPIRGNLDEPDFKYGALVWKTFANLVLKAVASPFKFLGSMMGIDGADLEYVEFEAGSFMILPSEREKLDNIAKLLIKRPKISINIGGGYNLQTDKLSIQKAKLASLVVKLSGAKNEEERVNAMTTDLLEDIYKKAKDDDKLDKLEDKLQKKYKDEEFDRNYLLALIKLCSGIQEVSVEEIQKLARDRREIIRTYLIDTRGIVVSRIKILKILEVANSENKLIKSKLEVSIK
ncbi:MAG: DUF748 domain-containing protein, partial [Sulfurimonas sp.]|nr:DUF748 domain-containing protein [Sulfurimonas sp.]